MFSAFGTFLTKLFYQPSPQYQRMKQRLAQPQRWYGHPRPWSGLGQWYGRKK